MMPKTSKWRGWLSLLMLAVAAAVAATSDDAWQRELLKEREEKDIEFRSSPTSPMAGRERLTVPAAEKTFILVRGDEVRLSALVGDPAGRAFVLLFSEGRWLWDEGAPGVSCRARGRDVAPATEALPPGCLFQAGRFTLAAYPGPDALALIVFDPQRRQQLDFERLRYFPPDARYAVKARLEVFAKKSEVKIVTTRKLEKTFYRYGRVHFSVAGRELALIALKSSLEGPDADSLFIPFRDLTSGKESYEVGRFLDVADPGPGGFILDFNRCYNPLCNYSPAYNCPLPPLENFLDVSILAGEKTYPH